MMQTASSGSNAASSSPVATQLAQVVDKLDQQLPKPRVCAAGLSQTLTVQQFDSLTASW